MSEDSADVDLYRAWRSPSQLSTYSHCGLQYKLRYRTKTPRRPMWAGVGGTAYHACVREFESSISLSTPREADDTKGWDEGATTHADRFARHFAEAIADQVLSSPGHSVSEWYAGSKNEDRAWWLEEGPAMVYRYVMAQRGRTHHVPLVTGEPLLEVEASMDIDGIQWRGFIDRITWHPATGQLVIEDDKTGSRWPEDQIQIDTYGWWAIKHLVPSLPWGDKVKSVWARYWSARKGEYILPADVTERTPWPVLTYRYATFDKAERAGIYPANPSNMCKPCPVRSACPVKGGDSVRVNELLPLLTIH